MGGLFGGRSGPSAAALNVQHDYQMVQDQMAKNQAAAQAAQQQANQQSFQQQYTAQQQQFQQLQAQQQQQLSAQQSASQQALQDQQNKLKLVSGGFFGSPVGGIYLGTGSGARNTFLGG